MIRQTMQLSLDFDTPPDIMEDPYQPIALEERRRWRQAIGLGDGLDHGIWDRIPNQPVDLIISPLLSSRRRRSITRGARLSPERRRAIGAWLPREKEIDGH
jgi:hypothetical protein